MKASLLFMVSVFFLSILAIISTQAYAANNIQICPADYSPVCATVPVQCIKAPCKPLTQTFANSCVAKVAGATTYSTWVCQVNSSQIVGNDRDSHGCIWSAWYSWSAVEKKCIRPWEKKVTSRELLQSGTWVLKTFNGKAISWTWTLTFEKNSFNAKLCNTLNGQYGVLKNTIFLRKVMATRMYCEGEFMPIESILSISARLTFTISENTLTLLTKNGDTLVWKR